MSADNFHQPSKHPKVTCLQVVDTEGVLAHAGDLEMLKTQVAEMHKTINRMNDSFAYAVKTGAGSASSAEERKQMAEALAKEFPDEVLQIASNKVGATVANFAIMNYGRLIREHVLEEIKERHVRSIKDMVRENLVNQIAQEIEREGVLKEVCARVVHDTCEDAKSRLESMSDFPKNMGEKFEEVDDAVTRIVQAIADLEGRIVHIEARLTTLSLTNGTQTGVPETAHAFAQPQNLGFDDPFNAH